MADSVNHPSHYTSGAIEAIDAIRSALGDEGFRAFCAGQVIKYLWRYQHKGKPVEDVCKAQWYLDALARTMQEGTDDGVE